MTNSYVAHQTETTNTISRALLDPSEIMRLSETEALFMQAREFPARMVLPDLSAWSWTKEIQDLNDYKMPHSDKKLNTWTLTEDILPKKTSKKNDDEGNGDKESNKEKFVVKDDDNDRPPRISGH